MNDPRMNAINQMRGIDSSSPLLKTSDVKKQGAVSFSETMKRYINDANDLQTKADNDIKRIIAGEEVDAHEVMTAVEKAGISFEMVMEIRNKMLEAYREVMKTPL